MDPVLIAIGAAVLLLLGWQFIVFRRARTARPNGLFPPGTTLSPRPLLTHHDVYIYNMLKLAAQDRYLVFAQVPLASVVAVKAEDRSRLNLLSRIALKRVDFVLVHPGSGLVERAILVEEVDACGETVEWQRVVESVLQASGIAFVKLKATTDYTVPSLLGILGLGSEE